MKRYRLGNQPEEYELSEKYLGWIPEGLDGWEKFCGKYFLRGTGTPPAVITLVSPNKEERTTFNLHQGLIKDAFPMSFFGEARTAKWWNFLLVSEKETPQTRFIIPMH